MFQHLTSTRAGIFKLVPLIENIKRNENNLNSDYISSLPIHKSPFDLFDYVAPATLRVTLQDIVGVLVANRFIVTYETTTPCNGRKILAVERKVYVDGVLVPRALFMMTLK